MNKNIFRLLMAVILLLSLCVPVCATEAEETIEETVEEVVVRTLKIESAEEFLEFAENCRLDSYSQNLEVSLETDIDLSNTDFQGIPIFCGTFRGKNHIISGLSLESDGSYQGLFRYLSADAIVRDLKVTGNINPTGILVLSHVITAQLFSSNASMRP